MPDSRQPSSTTLTLIRGAVDGGDRDSLAGLLDRLEQATAQIVAGRSGSAEQERPQVVIGLAGGAGELGIARRGAPLDEGERLQHGVVEHPGDLVTRPPIGDLPLGTPQQHRQPSEHRAAGGIEETHGDERHDVLRVVRLEAVELGAEPPRRADERARRRRR